MFFSRRRFLYTAVGTASLTGSLYSPPVVAAGGRLIAATGAEPGVLASGITSAGPTQAISGKIFDGLFWYDTSGRPHPRLARNWIVAADGLTITFRLRPGVTWHDGQPFTSADVAFSVLEVWKQYHSRGRSTFANVTKVDTPDPLTAVWHLSSPAPYILAALDSVESQVVPRHVYAKGDILTNPANTAPIGTGPFRFVEWKRGEYVALARNPTYWDRGHPLLDQLIFRFLPDSSAALTALETGEVQLLLTVPQGDVARVAKMPGINVTRRDSDFNATLSVFEFNLDKPAFKDVRVRRALAHAIDREFIVRNILYGYGEVENSPIPRGMGPFHSDDVPTYPFDLGKAAALLDAAGFRPGRDGTRLSFTHDPLEGSQIYISCAQFIRATLAKIGVRMEIRLQDYATFVRRVYTSRDFDTMTYGASAGPDPAIGTQRFYWSKNFQPGVAFSNGAHYRNPQVDRLLEQAQVELDPVRRHRFYADFQKIVETDLPRIPLFSSNPVILSKGVKDFAVDAYRAMGNFAQASLVAT